MLQTSSIITLFLLTPITRTDMNIKTAHSLQEKNTALTNWSSANDCKHIKRSFWNPFSILSFNLCGTTSSPCQLCTSYPSKVHHNSNTNFHQHKQPSFQRHLKLSDGNGFQVRTYPLKRTRRSNALQAFRTLDPRRWSGFHSELFSTTPKHQNPPAKRTQTCAWDTLLAVSMSTFQGYLRWNRCWCAPFTIFTDLAELREARRAARQSSTALSSRETCSADLRLAQACAGREKLSPLRVKRHRQENHFPKFQLCPFPHFFSSLFPSFFLIVFLQTMISMIRWDGSSQHSQGTSKTLIAHTSHNPWAMSWWRNPKRKQ